MTMVAFPSGAVQSGDRDPAARRLVLVLLAGLVGMSALALGTGASGVALGDLAGAWWRGEAISQRDWVVLVDIRLPRLVMGILVGAALAVSGALMQGLFRNPLADPGLVGVGAGAALGAVLAIVLGGMLPVGVAAVVGTQIVPVAAFLGGWLATILLYAVSSRQGRTSVATMLLAGIALAALATAAMGILIYLADDRQLRDLTFWSMGSLGGASWEKIAVAAPMILVVIVAASQLARGLNLLALGEAAALHAGVEVERLKTLTVLGVAAATGAAVAVSGGIGFIGIVVPHLVRLAVGPDHRFLLPNAALLGAILLVGADIIARLVVMPAELPIGIVTALLGAPVFLAILLRNRGILDL
jgi:iron complex transport system permease protein